MIFRLLAAVLIVLPTAAFAADPLAFELLGDETYTEQIVAMADLEDGTYVKVLFVVSNVGPGDGKGACKVMIVEPNGDVVRASAIVERDGWSYDEKTKTLRIGKCVATARGGLVFEAPLAEAKLRLELAEAPKRERAAKVDEDGDFWTVDTLVKWAPATATIERNEKKRTVAGYGYADHPRSKIMPSTLAKRWFRFRGLEAKDPRLVVIRFPQSGAPVGWHEARTGRVDIERAQLAPIEKKQWRARFKGSGGEWRVTTTTRLHRDAPIEEQGRILSSMISAVVGNPVTYLYRGTLVERGTKKEIPGIVEVTITDE